MNLKQLKQKARDLKLSLVTSATDDIGYAKKRAADARAADYLPCAKALALVEDAGYEVKSRYIRNSSYGTHLDIRITVQSLKDDALTALLLALEPLTGAEFTNRAYASEWSQEMTFTSRNYDTAGLNICLECTIASDSPTCRKVVVGEKTEVVKVYELQCD